MINELDVHDMDVNEARYAIEKRIEECSRLGISSLTVIHGYRHGSRLRELCSKASNFKTKRIRLVSQEPFQLNPGITHFILR